MKVKQFGGGSESYIITEKRKEENEVSKLEYVTR